MLISVLMLANTREYSLLCYSSPIERLICNYSEIDLEICSYLGMDNNYALILLR